ncbi:hypothetical protein RV11_GL003324 [Enterococcus phoeniculicola]|nr:hypothetical protein RV11_GL003324 [Enterococcus phoeniculicola]
MEFHGTKGKKGKKGWKVAEKRMALLFVFAVGYEECGL